MAPYRATFRSAAGLGGGPQGIAARWGISGEGWLTPSTGVGAYYEAALQDTNCWLCQKTNEAAQSAGLSVAVRTRPRGSYGFLAFGAGYAWARRWQSDWSFFGGSTRAPDTKYAGAMVHVTAAWLFHAGPCELGPVIVASATTWGSAALTGNMALGFALE